MEKMENWIVEIESPRKREMLMNFTDKFHLERDYPNCRNKSCQKPLKQRDGPAICTACCSYYGRNGKIRIIKESELNGKQKNFQYPYMKSPNCHDPICNQPLAKDEKGDFCQSCFSLNERKKNLEESEKKIDAIIGKNKKISKIKIEMLKEFSAILDLGDCNLNCRNRYCRKLLDESDGPAICYACYRYYQRSNGKLSGKNKPIRKRKVIPSEKNIKIIKQKKANKVKKKRISRNQNSQLKRQKRTRIATDKESIEGEGSCENSIKEIPILPSLPVSFPGASTSIPLLNQSSQQAELLLNHGKIIKDSIDPFELESFNYSKDDFIYHLNDYGTNNIIGLEGMNNDFLI